MHTLSCNTNLLDVFVKPFWNIGIYLLVIHSCPTKWTLLLQNIYGQLNLDAYYGNVTRSCMMCILDIYYKRWAILAILRDIVFYTTDWQHSILFATYLKHVFYKKLQNILFKLGNLITQNVRYHLKSSQQSFTVLTISNYVLRPST